MISSRSWLLLVSLFVLFLVACQPNNSTPTTSTKVALDSSAIGAADPTIFEEKISKNAIDTHKFVWIIDSTFYTAPTVLLTKLDSLYDYSYTAKTKVLSKQHYLLQGQEKAVYLLQVAANTATQDCEHTAVIDYFLFDYQGQLLLQKQAKEVALLPMLKDSIALLMTLEVNCDKMGSYQLYAYQNGEMIDVLNTLLDEAPITYDGNAAGGQFQKDKLRWSVVDLNEDGYNDWLLEGKWLVLENEAGRIYKPSYPYKIEPIRQAYIYIPAKELFLKSS